MLDKQKRLNEVYEHLHNHFGVHTKGDFADNIKYARAYISSALNGNERYLTDKLFTNICDAYPGVFNLDYLLTGKGYLLTEHEDAISSEIEQGRHQQPDDAAALNNILEMYARMIRGVDDLRVELNTNLAEVRALKEDLHTAVNDFRDATYRLTQALRTLNDNRTSLRAADVAADDIDY